MLARVALLAPQCAVALSALRPGGGGLSGGVVTLAVSRCLGSGGPCVHYRYYLVVAWGALLGDTPRAIVLLVPDLEGIDPLHILWAGVLVRLRARSLAPDIISVDFLRLAKQGFKLG